VHVGIDDQDIVGEPPDKLGRVHIMSFKPDDMGNVAGAGFPVIVLRTNAEDLGKVLDMHEGSVPEPVGALNGRSLSVESTDHVGQVPDDVRINEPERWYIHADQPGERHHWELALGHMFKLA